MNISTTNSGDEQTALQNPTAPISKAASALADSLTLVRVFLAPIVAIVILYGWPMTGFSVLASVLFAIGALTDLFDDMIGGAKNAGGRIFGWFDDIADAILIGLALLAMLFVIHRGGYLNWTFILPVVIYIGRDVLVGLIKGFEFSKNGMPQSRMSDIKNALAMLGVSLMIASPWLQQIMDRLLAPGNGEALFSSYNNASPWIWALGHGTFSIAAILALISGIKHLRRAPNNTESAT